MKKNIDLSANGKLLLTGEYLVMAGARALALPVKFGQTLHGYPSGIPGIRWTSIQPGGEWFSCELWLADLEVRSASNLQVALHLVRLLKAAQNFNPSFLTGSPGWDISVNANYQLNWGMGSSSTLISLIAQWSGADPFALLRAVSHGSGYDVACATRKEMLFFSLQNGTPEILPAFPGKALREHACFAYLGNKQETAGEVSGFLSARKYEPDDLDRISQLSRLICNAEEPTALIALVREHEAIIGRILQKEPISFKFPAFSGIVKSLGAWGGDFGMFASELSNRDIKDWLVMEGFPDAFTLEELRILK